MPCAGDCSEKVGSPARGRVKQSSQTETKQPHAGPPGTGEEAQVFCAALVIELIITGVCAVLPILWAF